MLFFTPSMHYTRGKSSNSQTVRHHAVARRRGEKIHMHRARGAQVLVERFASVAPMKVSKSVVRAVVDSLSQWRGGAWSLVLQANEGAPCLGETQNSMRATSSSEQSVRPCRKCFSLSLSVMEMQSLSPVARVTSCLRSSAHFRCARKGMLNSGQIFVSFQNAIRPEQAIGSERNARLHATQSQET